jgi:hypothetical protein
MQAARAFRRLRLGVMLKHRTVRLLTASWMVLWLSSCVAFGGDPGVLDAGDDASAADDAAAGDAHDATTAGDDASLDAGSTAAGPHDAATDARVAPDAAIDAAATDADTPDATTAIDAGADAGDAASAANPRLELGTSVPDGVFVAFAPGDAIPISSAGQSGTVLDLALRTYDMPADLFLTVRATPEGGEPITVRQPGPTPDSFTCVATYCELLPLRVVASALGAPADLVGTVVRVQVAATDGADLVVGATHDGPLEPP